MAKKRSRANSAGTSLTKCEKAHRDQVDQVVKWALMGVSANDLREAVEEAFPDEDPLALLAAASADFRAAGKADRTVVLGFCLQASRDLYRRSLEIGDFATALRAIKQMAQLTGR